MDNVYTKDDIVVFVYTCGKYSKRANAIAQTWGKGVPCIHYITDTNGMNLPNAVNFGKFEYKDLVSKSLLMWKYAYEKYGNSKKWFLKIDDDSYLFFDNLIRTLSAFDFREPWYIGDTKSWSKHKKNEIFWVAGGSGILLSQKCLTKLMRFVNTPEKEDYFKTLSEKEDVALGKQLHELGIPSTHVAGFHAKLESVLFQNLRNLISIHQLTPRNLWTVHILFMVNARSLNEIYMRIHDLRFKIGLRTRLRELFKGKKAKEKRSE